MTRSSWVDTISDVMDTLSEEEDDDSASEGWWCQGGSIGATHGARRAPGAGRGPRPEDLSLFQRC